MPSQGPQRRGMQPGTDALHLFRQIIRTVSGSRRPTFFTRLPEVSRFVTAPSPGSRRFEQWIGCRINLIWRAGPDGGRQESPSTLPTAFHFF